MNLAELRRLVRRIEIRSRRAVSGQLAGFYRSASLGKGLAFEEVRAYQPGDDVRHIDGKVTARMGEPFVKKFASERERSLWVIVDTSPSMGFGGRDTSKWRTAVEAAALLALSAVATQDRVGLATFGSSASVTPPARGNRHALRVIRDLLAMEPVSSGEPLERAAERVRRFAKQRSLVFVVSDFLFDEPARSLRRLCRRHQVFALGVIDPLERELPAAGLVRWRDLETGETRLIDCSSKRYVAAYRAAMRRREEALRRSMARWDIGWIPLSTDRAVALAMMKHFGK